MSLLPTVEGVIRRRVLVNYRVDPQMIRLPSRFRPKLHEGHAIAGICLIRLEEIRPRRIPRVLGISSENAAHRIAVTWDEEHWGRREGVFVFRRDTGSRLNHFAGGRVFPGEHSLARFEIEDVDGRIDFSMKSRDESVAIEFSGAEASYMPSTSVFKSIAEASSFFEAGSLGYSVTRDPCRFDGLALEIDRWRARPLTIERVRSSFFDDRNLFPPGTAQFDHALVMRDIAHRWRGLPDLFA